ncbi:MAG: methyltransferase domain-containing protein [Pseudomonadota bacterium]
MAHEKSLDGAYELETPEDSVQLYRDWAKDYDKSFAESHGYIVPQQLARIFEEHADGESRPILDIGAGTGLVGAELSGEIDAIDISAEMLEVAGQKGVYRNLIQADLTQPVDIASETYRGLVSAGTFTHGHVGPVCLPELLRIAKPSAVFCLSINAQVFDKAGFGSAFARLVADGAITPLSFRHIRYYEDSATHDHSDDTGLVAVFRKL